MAQQHKLTPDIHLLPSLFLCYLDSKTSIGPAAARVAEQTRVFYVGRVKRK